MTKLLLLVEDNDSDAKLTLRALSKCGVEHEIVLQEDGADALDWLFARGRFADRDATILPCVVLLDLNLPKIDGLEVLKQIRANERTRLIPVVLMTSSNEHIDVLRCVGAGANAFVQKPVDYSAFMDGVKTLGVFWLTLNEIPRGEEG